MANRRKGLMDIRTILHHLRSGASERQVACDLGVNRGTVRRYHKWARVYGFMSGELPSLESLSALADKTLPEAVPPQNRSSVAGYRDVVSALLDQGVERAAIHQRLKERGYPGSYASVYRFCRTLSPKAVDAVVRVEREPGEEAQVDFGYAGLMIDPVTGKLRRTWAFVMSLSYSRHQYVEFVFDQKTDTFIKCHCHGFSFFGGVPRRVVIDNLKAAITRALFHDPQVQHSYRECAEHYGFLIAPCRVRTPEHKGKVEQGGVHYLKRNFLGGRLPTALTQANEEVAAWCLTTAGYRVHGTVKDKPLERFETVEKERLLPLPPTAYDLALWKRVKLHRDCHVVFDNAYYSAPFRYIGQQLLVSGGLSQVRLYTSDYQLAATHDRASRPGERKTHPDHLPPYKLPALTLTKALALARAETIGPQAHRLVTTWLEDPVLDRLYTCGALLSLADHYGQQRLEAACARALAFDDQSYSTVKAILQKGLDQHSLPALAPCVPATAFVRSAEELVGHLEGGQTWN